MIPDAAMERLAQEVYAAHFLLWNLGFEPEHLFVSAQLVLNIDPAGVHACVKVQRAGLEFVIPLGPELDGRDRRRFFKAWRRFSKEAVTLRREQRARLDRLVQSTAMYGRKMDLVVSLLAKGFELTGASN